MSSKVTIKKDVEKREVVLERVLVGSQELVWRCLTTPVYIDQWWGPEGWTTETKTMNVQPGGLWHYCMRGHSLEEWGLAQYEIVEEPNRIVYAETASNEAGQKQVGRRQHVTITLRPEENARTAISICTRFSSLADLEAMVRMGMKAGYAAALDKLEIVIKQKQSPHIPS